MLDRLLVLIAFCIAFTGLVMGLSVRLAYSQEVGCYQIDRFGVLCIPSTGEIFVEQAHDGYTKWMQPHKPTVSCCNKQDCEPVEARFDDKRGTYQAKINGQWVDIPSQIILDPKKPENATPDGSYHACWNRVTNELLCFREAEPKI
jgi:hypothetical protein